MMQHDAITQLPTSRDTIPTAINAAKRAYDAELKRHGFTRADVLQNKSQKPAPQVSYATPNADSAAIHDKIIDLMNLDDIHITPDGTVRNLSQERRKEIDIFKGELVARSLGLNDFLERQTTRNAAVLEQSRLRNEILNLENQWLDYHHDDPRRIDLNRRIRALKLQLQATETQLL